MHDGREYWYMIKGRNFYVLVVEGRKDIPYARKSMENLVEIRIKSPESIERISGVVFLIYQKLFEKGINIIETYSCWMDTVILVEKADMIRTVKALEELGIK